MTAYKGIVSVLSLVITSTGFATLLPLDFIKKPLIEDMVNQSSQLATFTIKNNTSKTLPLTIRGISDPVSVSSVVEPSDCGNVLAAHKTCNLQISIRPTSVGEIHQTLSIDYNGRNPLDTSIQLHVASGLKTANPITASFTGVDYAPAHYSPTSDPRNTEDEANVTPELKQLQEAGFNTVRMYKEPGKTWIAAINAANNQGMKVVYQLATCQSDPISHACINGPGTFASVLAVELVRLKGVIDQVGKPTFKKVVSLVLVGNENYITNAKNQSNLSDLLTAVADTRAIIDPLDIPVSISLQGDVWISTNSKIKADLTKLAAALTPKAPIGINIYPFQWVVPVAKSVNSTTAHSIEWYLSGLHYPKNPLMITETGWATDGNYFVGKNRTTGNIQDSEDYFPQLYTFTSGKYSLLSFMAFDVPTKTTNSNLTSENFYGVFDSECNLKTGGSNPHNLLPAGTAYKGTAQCSDANAIFTFNGSSNTAQPPFSIQYNHGGFTYLVQVPTAVRTNQDLTPWPTITLSAGDKVTLVSSSSSCTNTVQSINASHAGGIWVSTAGTGSGHCNEVNWANGQSVFLPTPY